MEIEVGQRFSDLHGVNDDFGQRTADGKSLEATTALFNIWPSVRIADGWTAYIGGGFGGRGSARSAATSCGAAARRARAC